VGETIQKASVLAAPCVVAADGDRDGMPTVLLEAMALGTPAVSTDVTGIPELVFHERTGLSIPQHDPPALANALDTLMKDQSLRVQLAARARRLIEEKFDVHANARKIRRDMLSITPAGVWAQPVAEPA
jgi:glycosyltransferase involved in cell wall biosynthesis